MGKRGRGRARGFDRLTDREGKGRGEKRDKGKQRCLNDVEIGETKLTLAEMAYGIVLTRSLWP